MIIEVKNDEMLGRTNNTTLHIELIKSQQENKQLKEVIEEVREDIVFCINGMKNEFACTDSRTNRELHTMVKILEEGLRKIDKTKVEDERPN